MLTLLVLAGGFGTRLHAVLDDVPKALAPVETIPFLRHQVEHWIAQGVRDFVFLLHHRAERVIDYLMSERDGLLCQCRIRWTIEPVPLGTGGAIAHAVRELCLDGDFLVCNADTWLGTGIAELERATAPALAVVRLLDTRRYGAVDFDAQELVTAFNEKSTSAEAGWINTGLCRLDTGLFAAWDGGPYSLEQVVLPELVHQGRLRAVPLRTEFIDIGVPADYVRYCDWIAAGRKGMLCD